MATQKAARAHFYRKFRGNMERSAESAFASARSHIHFLASLHKMVTESKRRSRAAKRGWAKRRES